MAPRVPQPVEEVDEDDLLDPRYHAADMISKFRQGYLAVQVLYDGFRHNIVETKAVWQGYDILPDMPCFYAWAKENGIKVTSVTVNLEGIQTLQDLELGLGLLNPN